MGWEQLSYETSEDAGTVTVCANFTGQTERDVSVIATSTDGSAIGSQIALSPEVCTLLCVTFFIIPQLLLITQKYHYHWSLLN